MGLTGKTVGNKDFSFDPHKSLVLQAISRLRQSSYDLRNGGQHLGSTTSNPHSRRAGRIRFSGNTADLGQYKIGFQMSSVQFKVSHDLCWPWKNMSQNDSYLYKTVVFLWFSPTWPHRFLASKCAVILLLFSSYYDIIDLSFLVSKSSPITKKMPKSKQRSTFVLGSMFSFYVEH